MLFGSSVRGKETPRDVDLLVIFKDSVDSDVVHAMRRTVEKLGFDADVVGKTWRETLQASFLPREKILAEGYSLVSNNFLYALWGYSSFTMFRYSLLGKKSSERMRFYYALMGRKIKGKREIGMLDELGGIKFANSVVLMPTSGEEKFADFLNSWRIKHKRIPILIPKNMLVYGRKEVIL
ncbi:MAG: nucleotidyltransferase domain-containing protein [Candidatus Micrarchaeota archaeon]